VTDKQRLLRELPSVDEVLRSPQIAVLEAKHPHELLVDCIRQALDAQRARILSGKAVGSGDVPKIAVDILNDLLRPRLVRLINATGIIIHTNLGRSILSKKAQKRVVEIGGSYSNLEFDIAAGKRGSRHDHVEHLMTRLTGAEAAMVVNNNAAAVLVVLAALAKRKETIVSRGELVEIGGSFRIPDIMSQSGSRLVEVGTTNKTYVDDYRAAITDRTGCLLKVHSSNFRVMGFTAAPSLEELVALGAEHGIPVVEDQGSGVLIDLRQFGLPYEPTVQESIAAGLDLVTCSGDKLFGGPQAGLIFGKEPFVKKLKKHPLARALRIDKMTLAAMEATLQSYLNPERLLAENPTIRMLTAPTEAFTERASSLAESLADVLGDRADVAVEDDVARAGGGSLPLADIPTLVVTVKPRDRGPDRLERALRTGSPAIICRIKEDKLVLDLRTIQPGEEKEIVTALKRAREAF
jgi:L-seryl-tRNA(Ser) seleniumtransferase